MRGLSQKARLPTYLLRVDQQKKEPKPGKKATTGTQLRTAPASSEDELKPVK